MNPHDPNNLADPDHPDLVEDLPLEEVDMEASDRALDAMALKYRAELLARGIDISVPEGHPDTRGTDDSKV